MSKQGEYTNFPDQPIRLRCVDPGGGDSYRCALEVARFVNEKSFRVISHPLTITQRIRDIETGCEKVTLAYCLRPDGGGGSEWQTATVERTLIASNTSITKLSGQGIIVDSNNAREVMRYLSALLTLNPESIPTVRGCSHLGWSDGARRFLPFSDEVAFSGDPGNAPLNDAARSSSGSMEEWRAAASELYAHPAGRITFAASFASALVRPLNAQTFIVHLFGLSGCGKTVAQMGAASAWGDPDRMVQSFNGTAVGLERTLGFLNSFPLILDEAQLGRDPRTGRTVFNLYAVTEGIGKTRGRRDGGVDLPITWQNIIITSGENALLSSNAAAGEKNRCIEVEITGSVTDRGAALAQAFRENYGHAGRLFVKHLFGGGLEAARVIYQEAKGRLPGVTGKQMNAAALLLTADRIAHDAGILPGGVCLTENDLLPFLLTAADIDPNPGIYERLIDWVQTNEKSFRGGSGNSGPDNEKTMQPGIYCFGKLEPGIAHIIRSHFDEAVERFGGTSRSFLKWAAARSLIDKKRSGRYSYSVRIGAAAPECVALILPDLSDEDTQ